jgi:hypothetical protein
LAEEICAFEGEARVIGWWKKLINFG